MTGGFTLLESGTSRFHFQLAKSLEDATSDIDRDAVVRRTVSEARHRLVTFTRPSDTSKLFSTLLTLLHCTECYPHSSTSSQHRLDLSFALLPTLQLISVADKWQHLQAAYQLLSHLFAVPPSPTQLSTTFEASDSAAIEAGASSHSKDIHASPSSSADSRALPSAESTSLMTLNTLRMDLVAAERASSSSRRHRSSNRSRRSSASPARSASGHLDLDKGARPLLRATAALSALSRGISSGPSTVSLLAAPLVNLTRHPEPHVRGRTLDAMLQCCNYDLQGSSEMLGAMLTVVRLALASPYAFDSGVELDGQDDGIIVAEMSRRVESSPAILRVCLRVVDRCRQVSAITAQEAASHAVEVLQAIRWAPLHVKVPGLQPQAQQQRVQPEVQAHIESLRSRAVAESWSENEGLFDHRGLYSPWLLMACMDSLRQSFGCLTREQQDSARSDVVNLLLGIYERASRVKASALSVCVSTAKCIGSLCTGARVTTGDVWTPVAAHVQTQLASTNANRKVAVLEILTALLPIGWSGQPQDADKDVVLPTILSEADMGRLMGLLSDLDSTVRRKTMRLLNEIDGKLLALHYSQLCDALKAELGTRSLASTRPPNETAVQAQLVERLVETAVFQLTAQSSTETRNAHLQDLVQAVESAVEIGVFDHRATGQDAIVGLTVALGSLDRDTHVHFVRRLVASLKVHQQSSTKGSSLSLALLCNLGARELLNRRGRDTSTDDYFEGTEFLDYLVDLLEISSALPDRALSEATIATLAHVVACLRLADSSDEGRWDLGLDRISAVLEKGRPAFTTAALEVLADNLQRLLRDLGLAERLADNSTLIGKLKRLGTRCGTVKDAVANLLHLEQVAIQDTDLESLRISGGRSQNGGGGGGSSSSSSHRGRFIDSWPRSLGSSTDRSTSSIASKPPTQRLPETLWQASRSLTDSAATIRSDHRNRSESRSGPRTAADSRSRTSAIPSEAKRNRDKQIAQSLSQSIAQLVVGTDQKSPRTAEPDDVNEVIFSVDDSDIFQDNDVVMTHQPSTAADSTAFPLVSESVDPDRQLQARIAGEDQQPTLIDLVHSCHNYDPWLDESLMPFVVDGAQIGYVPPRVVQAILEDAAQLTQQGQQPPLVQVRYAAAHKAWVPPGTPRYIRDAITFSENCNSAEERTKAINELAQRWRQAKLFPDPLDGWRDELYAIYARNPRPAERNTIAFKLERSACALFGFATFGVHLTAYTHIDGELKVWVPQRSQTKSTWPGYLDNSVAGGIVAGDLPMDSIVRECEEEASLPPSTTTKFIKQTGVLTYCYRTSAQGWIQPEIEYVYDLPLPPDVILQPKDDEVDHFELLSLAEIDKNMRQGRFKANCVLVMIDFLIRHGYITADQEPHYRQIVAQIHTDLQLPGP
ncbi:hypothetical protein BCV70DRAFT_200670 [Testicularia cyperi]|uniref:Nudix hydrolase domain-containing protein n=1 Tax=Testicularia cyperi TaxID=1882483 RepID=A0A317XPG3_9BASI|nr:hypothetical protein BCV70DRAFT_200670 [Testicularia cyperi]